MVGRCVRVCSLLGMVAFLFFSLGLLPFFSFFFQQEGIEERCADGPPPGVGPWASPMVA
jgi:hypothetical protein